VNLGRICGAAALCLLMSGCALIGGGSPQLDTFELTSPSEGDGGSRGRTQILIPEPQALKTLDGQNIVIRSSATEVQYLKGAQWADRLPVVVQAKLAETFQRSGRFGGVGQPGEGLAIDYQIVSELRSFDIRVDGTPRAQIEIFVRVLNDRNGQVRASRIFRSQAAVSGTGNQAYVAALNAAFGQISLEIVDWADGLI
jgi:cholesterol transport system auxiliary component